VPAVLLIFITLLPLVAAPLVAQVPSYPPPHLESVIDNADIVTRDHRRIPFRGVLMEVNEVREIYPTASAIFFAKGSADLPDRYHRFSSPTDAAVFTDTTIPGGTLQKYEAILDVVGFRMRRHPGARLTLRGSLARGERRDLARRRGERVGDYLRAIWGIAPERIAAVTTGTPLRPSDPDDPLGDAENARVEIGSDDPTILAPVVARDVRVLPIPDTMRFRMSNGIPDSLVAGRDIEILRNGAPWHLMRGLPLDGELSPIYDFGKMEDGDILPADESPYVARLVVRDLQGREHRSNEVVVPVRLITPNVKVAERLIDSVKESYTLTLFPFDVAAITETDRAWMAWFIKPPVPGLGRPRIEVVGRTDIIGSEAHNQALSEQRARSVASVLRDQAGYTTLTVRSVGEEDPLYPNDLPEGRFYNRTAQIRIAWPVP
jgi:outer membrane protein OmpA-like peptidoglycan-associated protein